MVCKSIPLAVESMVSWGMAGLASISRRATRPRLTRNRSHVEFSACDLSYVCPLTHTLLAVPVKGLAGKVIVDIASGNQHSLLLDEEGYVVFLCTAPPLKSLDSDQVRLCFRIQWLLSLGPRRPAGRLDP